MKEYSGPHRVVLNRNDRNLGISEHLNRILELATGEFIVAADGDDVSLPERTARFVAVWLQHGKPAALVSGVSCIDATGNRTRNGNAAFARYHPVKAETRDASLLRFAKEGRPMLSTCCAAFSRELCEVFGPLPREYLVRGHHHFAACLAVRSNRLHPGCPRELPATRVEHHEPRCATLDPAGQASGRAPRPDRVALAPRSAQGFWPGSGARRPTELDYAVDLRGDQAPGRRQRFDRYQAMGEWWEVRWVDAAQAVSDPHRVGSAEGSTVVCAATAAFPDFHQSGGQMDSMEACHKGARRAYAVVPQPRPVMVRWLSIRVRTVLSRSEPTKWIFDPFSVVTNEHALSSTPWLLSQLG